MSNRSLVEINHDFCPRDKDLLNWAKQIQQFIRTGMVMDLPYGMDLKHTRHHSAPDPLRPKSDPPEPAEGSKP